MSDGGKKTYYRHGDGEQPNQWFEPIQVWEVKAADLSISPVYTAAIGEVRAYVFVCMQVVVPLVAIYMCACCTMPLSVCKY